MKFSAACIQFGPQDAMFCDCGSELDRFWAFLDSDHIVRDSLLYEVTSTLISEVTDSMTGIEVTKKVKATPVCWHDDECVIATHCEDCGEYVRVKMVVSGSIVTEMERVSR